MIFQKPENTYMDVPFLKEVKSDSIHILGIEFDGTSCFRKGANFGPNAFRDVSYGIEEFSPYLNQTIEDKSIFDLGNIIEEESWEKTHQKFLEFFKNIDLCSQNIKLLTLGGEHSISLSPIELYLKHYPNLTLIHLDAHADLRDGYEGYHYSHASIIRRSLDLFTDQNELIQYGIRSGTKEEFDWMKENQTLLTSRNDFLDKINCIDEKRPIYLTLDLDYFDPSFLPGTGTPEAGGEDFHSFISLVKILKNKNLVGADIVELAPNLDPTGNSSVFASKVLREILLTL